MTSTQTEHFIQLTLNKKEAALVSWSLALAHHIEAEDQQAIDSDMDMLLEVLSQNPGLAKELGKRIVKLAEVGFPGIMFSGSIEDAVIHEMAKALELCKDGHCPCDGKLCCICGQVKP